MPLVVPIRVMGNVLYTAHRFGKPLRAIPGKRSAMTKSDYNSTGLLIDRDLGAWDEIFD